MPQPPTDLRARLAGAGLVAASITAMNVATYGFTLAAARLLAPEHFGELTALMGIILVGNVVALGLQATTARRLATRSDPVRQAAVIRAARRATGIAAAAVTGLVIVLSPVLRWALDLTSWWSPLLVAATLAPLTVFGTQAGIAQGTRRWGRLAVLYAAMGGGRLVFGALAILVEARPDAAMVGVLIGTLAPVAVGWGLLRSDTSARRQRPAAASRSILGETLHGSHALLAYFALTNADAVLARVVFDPQDSGVYAAGLIVTKACLFLPQFITIVAFPDLARADDTRARRIAAGLIAALGSCVVLGTWLLPDLALAFVGGAEYEEVRTLLPLFALEGSAFALLHLLLYDALARRSRLITAVLWVALVAAAGVALGTVDRIGPLPILMTVAAGAVAVVAVLTPRRPGG